MNIFHNELMTNEWIKLNINNFVFKIKTTTYGLLL